MKHKCIFPAQVGTHIYRKGDIAELTEAEAAEYASSFTPVEGDEQAKPSTDPPLSRQEYMDRLQRMGIAFSVREKTESLKAKYDENANADARVK